MVQYCIICYMQQRIESIYLDNGVVMTKSTKDTWRFSPFLSAYFPYLVDQLYLHHHSQQVSPPDHQDTKSLLLLVTNANFTSKEPSPLSQLWFYREGNYNLTNLNDLNNRLDQEHILRHLWLFLRGTSKLQTLYKMHMEVYQHLVMDKYLIKNKTLSLLQDGMNTCQSFYANNTLFMDNLLSVYLRDENISIRQTSLGIAKTLLGQLDKDSPIVGQLILTLQDPCAKMRKDTIKLFMTLPAIIRDTTNQNALLLLAQRVDDTASIK